MLVRPKFAIELAALVTFATLSISACSSSQPRDINYGTDVGLGYVPPDGGGTTPPLDAALVDSASGDTANLVVVDGGVVDGGVELNASTDAGD